MATELMIPYNRTTALQLNAIAHGDGSLPLYLELVGRVRKGNGEWIAWVTTASGYHCGWDGTRVITLEVERRKDGVDPNREVFSKMLCMEEYL